ncbi:MAG: pepN 3 [Acidobacteria bacterium]|nr:pepN 3 [Acidobacteriota bacterium]
MGAGSVRVSGPTSQHRFVGSQSDPTLAQAAFAQPAPTPDGVELVLARLETLLQTGDSAGFASLVGEDASSEQVEQFAADLFRPGVRRAAVHERDRAQLAGALPGAGYRLVLEIFTETEGRARIVTTLLDVRRPAGSDAHAWRITAAQGLTSIEGLFRLRVNPSSRFAARGLTITATDLVITLEEGFVYHVESDAGVTGLVLFGRGVMRFTPAPPTEQGQLRIFAGSESLVATFDSAFVRMHPSQYKTRVSVDSLTPAPPDARELRRAQAVFERESQKSFSLDLRDLSRDPWYLLPHPSDALAEIHTRRHGALTYLRSVAQAEDVTLFDRDRRRTISLYASAERIATRGASFNEDDFRDYDVLDYNIDATVSPEREFIEGRARIRLRVQAPSVSSLTLRLADTLVVTGIASVEHGRLLHLRIRNQNSVIVNLPVALERNAELTLVVAYAGRVNPQNVEDEGVQASGERGEESMITPEPNFLLSNRAYWYPQNPITDYATATLRITVPEGFGCVASGQLRGSDEITLRDLLTLTEGKAYVFTAGDPLRYLALVVSRFVRVAETTIDAGGDKDAPGLNGMRIAVDANPRQQGRGRDLIGDVEAIVRFYAGLVGDAPYGSATVALVEHELPGGHSPGYFAVLNSPLPGSRSVWRDDPAAFTGFPEFFLAHELAHQWWGQAVGWRNYHEQWLSEGFAQYFAALYANEARGARAFQDMLRQFRKWSLAESDEGPIYLGYRLGHIKARPRIFRALVYNKGAAVLHMLRRLVGDETFFNAVRRFYTEQKFQKAGTEDLRRAFEAESGRSLERFFARWIYGAELPHLRYTRAVRAGAVDVRFEQVGELLFDIPVTVTITYADGRIDDVVVPVTERLVEWTVPTDGAVRRVQINRDQAAIAEFDES